MDLDQSLLIPGTSGTKLLLDGQDFGWPAELAIKSWVVSAKGLSKIAETFGLTPSDIVEAMSMEFAEPDIWFPTKSTLLPGKRMKAGPVLNVAYTQFRNIEHFPYDWRADIRGSGKKLLRFLKDNKPTGGRWRIIAHSQGGLVAVVASKLAARQAGGDDTAFSQLVSKLVLLAVPLAGTQKAAKALIDADSLGSNFAPHFRKIASSWPALYQMLPVWRGSVMVENTSGEFVSARYPLMHEKAWVQHDIVKGHIERARAARRDFFRSPLSKMRDVKVRVVMSKAFDTLKSVLQSSDGLAFDDQLPDDCGDTLVPYESTLVSLGDLSLDRTRYFGKPRDASTAEHYMLANDPAVFAFWQKVLED